MNLVQTGYGEQCIMISKQLPQMPDIIAGIMISCIAVIGLIKDKEKKDGTDKRNNHNT